MNNGVNQGSSPALNTGNPQAIGTPGLQPTQNLQGSGTDRSVLGLNTLNQVPNSVTINVPTTSQTSQTPSETTPVQPTSFVVPPLLVVAAVVLFVAGIIAFILSQFHSVDSAK